MTTQAVKDYLNAKNGKWTDFDGWYGAQCVDLVQDYSVNFLKAHRFTGDAINILDQPGTEYTKILNSPDPNNVPKLGDIIVWNIGSYGHTAICAEDVAPGAETFLSLDQNWYTGNNTGSNAVFVRHSWNSVKGWLRPKSLTAGGNAVETIKSMYWRLMGREADAGGINHYVKQVNDKGWEFVYNDLKNSAEGQKDWDRRNPERVAQLEQQAAQLPVIQKQLQEALNRPPKEVVKEVEKIVEVVKEVQVPVYTHDQETKNMITSIFNYFSGQFKTFQKYIKK